MIGDRDRTERAADLIERLLGDRAFRAEFRRHPGDGARAYGLRDVADELDNAERRPRALDERESRSSLAGALLAAAAEGAEVVDLVRGAHGGGGEGVDAVERAAERNGDGFVGAQHGIEVPDYPGDGASKAELAAWMAKAARAADLPPELPVMAALQESGLRNLDYGDSDSVGFFQMRTRIWDQGPWKGYAQRPELQMKWFITRAIEERNNHPGAYKGEADYGRWIADIERCREDLRGRYQGHLIDARELIKAGGGDHGGGETERGGGETDRGGAPPAPTAAPLAPGQYAALQPGAYAGPTGTNGAGFYAAVPPADAGAPASQASVAPGTTPVTTPPGTTPVTTPPGGPATTPPDAPVTAPGTPPPTGPATAAPDSAAPLPPQAPPVVKDTQQQPATQRGSDAADGHADDADTGHKSVGARMVALARPEIGEAETSENDSPRIAEYRTATAGATVPDQWCAYFVSWVAKKAGSPLGAQGQGFGAVDDVWAWAKSADRAVPNGAGTPHPGDLIILNQHIGIVEKVLPDGSIQTIEGNTSNQVLRRTHPAGEAIGYVRMR